MLDTVSQLRSLLSGHDWWYQYAPFEDHMIGVQENARIRSLMARLPQDVGVAVFNSYAPEPYRLRRKPWTQLGLFQE